VGHPPSARRPAWLLSAPAVNWLKGLLEPALALTSRSLFPSTGETNVADIISHSLGNNRALRNDRRDWSLIIGVAFSVLALTYSTWAVHVARHSSITAPSQSIWFPLELFVIAVSPASAAFIFIYWDKLRPSDTILRAIRIFAIFAVGLLLAAWVAATYQ
jgi:hypothetical protein